MLLNVHDNLGDVAGLLSVYATDVASQATNYQERYDAAIYQRSGLLAEALVGQADALRKGDGEPRISWSKRVKEWADAQWDEIIIRIPDPPLPKAPRRLKKKVKPPTDVSSDDSDGEEDGDGGDSGDERPATHTTTATSAASERRQLHLNAVERRLNQPQLQVQQPQPTGGGKKRKHSNKARRLFKQREVKRLRQEQQHQAHQDEQRQVGVEQQVVYSFARSS
jgi:hypothetical protein